MPSLQERFPGRRRSSYFTRRGGRQIVAVKGRDKQSAGWERVWKDSWCWGQVARTDLVPVPRGWRGWLSGFSGHPYPCGVMCGPAAGEGGAPQAGAECSELLMSVLQVVAAGLFEDRWAAGAAHEGDVN